jgi:Tol biopolymer transport system component
MARNTVTVVDRELFRYTSDDVMDRFFNISISPDGKWLAAINRGEDRVVRLISTESGETRDLYTFVSSGGQPYSQVWSRDGKYIIFPYPKQGTGIREWNLMGIPVEGGENLSIETNILRIDSPTLHPDGRTLVFSGPGYSYPENNIWEMKNFLPNSENTY